jgi:pyridoxal phosphate enzyme (YggS family)
VDLTEKVTEVRRRIGDGVRLVAVTKGFGRDAVDAAVAAGITDIGESYAQELRGKLPIAGATVHFVGRLQTNKVRQLVDVVDVWQSVDRLDLGEELARRAPAAAVLVQVNVSGEPQKAGCVPERTESLVGSLVELGLGVRGLMTVGDPHEPRSGFRTLRRLVDDLGLDECSMGMSNDLEVAVDEGATMVRVGRALFGERPRPVGTVTVGSGPETDPTGG